MVTLKGILDCNNKCGSLGLAHDTFGQKPQ